jgi:hypothetical protein
MSTWKKCLTGPVLVCGLLFASGLIITVSDSLAVAGTGKERHPHIHRALRELREARKELVTADHDFGGHRVEAIGAVYVAIKQLELALKFDKR